MEKVSASLTGNVLCLQVSSASETTGTVIQGSPLEVEVDLPEGSVPVGVVSGKQDPCARPTVVRIGEQHVTAAYCPECDTIRPMIYAGTLNQMRGVPREQYSCTGGCGILYGHVRMNLNNQRLRES